MIYFFSISGCVRAREYERCDVRCEGVDQSRQDPKPFGSMIMVEADQLHDVVVVTDRRENAVLDGGGRIRSTPMKRPQ